MYQQADYKAIYMRSKKGRMEGGNGRQKKWNDAPEKQGGLCGQQVLR